jgi:mono/diheme cytochrome c family protein
MITRATLAILSSMAAICVLSAQNPPTIQKVPIRPSSPVSGKDMFMQYCAACHGKDGKGNGPAAPALKKAPADLTTLAARNNDKFPEARVAKYIQGDSEVTAHGSRDMPIWGDLFRQLNREPGVAQMRLSNLEDYLKSIQAKASN